MADFTAALGQFLLDRAHIEQSLLVEHVPQPGGQTLHDLPEVRAEVHLARTDEAIDLRPLAHQRAGQNITGMMTISITAPIVTSVAALRLRGMRASSSRSMGENSSARMAAHISAL